MTFQESYERFIASPAFGVVGASNNPLKFGNRILKKYLSHSLKAYPVNPNDKSVEGLACLASVEDLPSDVLSISIITPPAITEKVVQEAIAKGIQNIWMQPGAESKAAIAECLKAGVNLIAGGPCLLVDLK